jgi:hypothetical protein
MSENPTPVVRLNFRLVGSGVLPPDLLAANDAAVYAAGLASSLVTALLLPPSAGTAKIVRSSLRGLYANAGPSREAVNQVAARLNLTRQVSGPARFDCVVESNAHLAALRFAAEVRSRIRIALLAALEGSEDAEDDADAGRLVNDWLAPLDPDLVARHLSGVREFIDLDGLPDGAELGYAVNIEADVAAASPPGNTLKANGRGNGQDKKQPAKDPRGRFAYKLVCKAATLKKALSAFKGRPKKGDGLRSRQPRG